ncbi:transporter substrate-binding domain-containing protein [Candidatus Clostridium stratigraminis]|uniref:Transporter substrate-binding domain-containing protein n=1 Tax=Candidatus Clostridium stratigraminis TaxID=3381661 RepID=A0ABW8T6M3_9CLOT
MNNKLKQIIAVSTIAIMALGFTACGKKDASASSNAATTTKVDKIKKAGQLVVGTSADYPPYEFHKSVSGNDEIVGFDIEIAKEIAKDLGVKLVIKDMDFKGLLNALESGNVDMVLAGMTPTEERKQSVDFSNIYYKAAQTLVVRTEDKDKIKTIDDLNGKGLGVQKGSIQEDIAKNQLPKAQAKALGKITDIALALKTKKIDAAIIESPVAKAYVNANKDFSISDIELKTEDAGSAVAVKKGETDLVDAINKTLDKLTNSKAIDKMVIDANNLVE